MGLMATSAARVWRVRDRTRPAALLLLLLGLTGCGEEAPSASARLWPEADRLFHSEPRWIGGDGAYSVDLGAGRVLWLFGDSFIANTPERVRAHSKMVRNCLAIQTGYDPSNAFMRFYWPEEDGDPQSFVAEEPGHWYWPMHGIALDGALILFFERLHSPEGDPTGFESDVWRAYRIPNPEADPADWTLQATTPPAQSHGLLLGEAAMRDGDRVYLYASAGSAHHIYVARLDAATLGSGRFDGLEWWTGDAWSESGDPAEIVGLGAPELSVHHDAKLGRYVMVQTEGYGAATLAWRVAQSPEGPWSDPRDIARPPESSEPDAFVYAGKAHPELEGADLVATYVPSSFEDRPVADEQRLYYAHFVRVTY
jgi:Domain of unknown function (DUF4185)